MRTKSLMLKIAMSGAAIALLPAAALAGNSASLPTAASVLITESPPVNLTQAAALTTLAPGVDQTTPPTDPNGGPDGGPNGGPGGNGNGGPDGGPDGGPGGSPPGAG